jgi:telomerase reverse transcriptase
MPVDVLNRYQLTSNLGTAAAESSDRQDLDRSTLQNMLYMFPRQFGLHNVFTSDVDTRQTVQPFQDYTLREDEIKEAFSGQIPKVPKKLRGRAAGLIQKFQTLQSRCPYKKLLDHYCPVSIIASPQDSC